MFVRRFAILTASLTFLLLLVGGLVHNTRSSLACPDWPLCYGQVFPKMEGGVLVEHSHRLLASAVGLCTIVLLVLLILRKQKGLAALGVGLLGLVIAQGVLGGLTVIYRLPTWISTTHLAVSQIFFCALIYVAFRTREQAEPEKLPPAVVTVTAIATVAVYFQMLVGALMRHLGAGLACLEVPLCRGSLWPAGAHGALQLHMFHRLLGIVVFAVVVFSSVVTFKNARGHLSVKVLAVTAPLLVCVQILLGISSVNSFLDVVPVTAHLGVAAALLANLWCLHLYARMGIGEPDQRFIAPVQVA